MALEEEMELAKELEGELSACTKEMSDLQDFAEKAELEAEQKASEKLLSEEETEELFDNSTVRAQAEELCSLQSGRALDVKEQYAEMADGSEVPNTEPTPTAEPVQDIAQADGTAGASRWSRKKADSVSGLPASDKEGDQQSQGLADADAADDQEASKQEDEGGVDQQPQQSRESQREWQTDQQQGEPDDPAAVKSQNQWWLKMDQSQQPTQEVESPEQPAGQDSDWKNEPENPWEHGEPTQEMESPEQPAGQDSNWKNEPENPWEHGEPTQEMESPEQPAGQDSNWENEPENHWEESQKHRDHCEHGELGGSEQDGEWNKHEPNQTHSGYPVNQAEEWEENPWEESAPQDQWWLQTDYSQQANNQDDSQNDWNWNENSGSQRVEMAWDELWTVYDKADLVKPRGQDDEQETGNLWAEWKGVPWENEDQQPNDLLDPEPEWQSQEQWSQKDSHNSKHQSWDDDWQKPKDPWSNWETKEQRQEDSHNSHHQSWEEDDWQKPKDPWSGWQGQENNSRNSHHQSWEEDDWQKPKDPWKQSKESNSRNSHHQSWGDDWQQSNDPWSGWQGQENNSRNSHHQSWEEDDWQSSEPRKGWQ